MKYLLLLTLSLIFVHPASAANQQLGAGVMLGNPSGLTGKYWLDEDHAVDAGLGMSIGAQTNFSMHSDYLFHNFSAFYLNDTVPLDLYFGVGGRMEFADDIELGVRLPLGLVQQIKEQNADLFAEVAPIIDFLGRTGVEVHLAVGARYYY